MNKPNSEIIAEDAKRIEAFLTSFPQLKFSDDFPEDKTAEAEAYALSAGGKRIRPVLAVEFYKLFSQSAEAPDFVFEAACALEMIHTFSLIHDDMPEMDNDDFRRGKPATHAKFGADIGLLAGDGLALLPFEILSQMSEDKKLKPEVAIKLTNILAAGSRGMIAGQTLDLWSENRAEGVDEAFLRKMSNLKTGCLLKAACLFGAVMAEADEKSLEKTAEYAENIGLAFQIVDDVLDVTSDQTTLGKPIGSDSERNKATFADVLGIDGALNEARRLSESAARAISEYPKSELLCEFALSLAERKK